MSVVLFISFFKKKKKKIKTESLAEASLKTSKNYSCNPAFYHVAATNYFMVSGSTFMQ